MAASTRQPRVVPGALTAAARPLTGTSDDAPQRHQRPWQDEAWAHYHDSGPLRFAATWIANLISRARLQAARVSPGSSEPEPLTSGPAAEVMDALAGGLDGQTALLKSLGIHLTVPGIGYLVGTDPGDGATWRIYSSKVLRLRSARTPSRAPVYELMTGERATWKVLPPDTLVIRVWRPDEEVYWEPDSPARAALSSLRELRRISQYVDAVLASRIASAGIFVFPTEASFPTAQGKIRPAGVHPFVTEVMETMVTAVKQPGTAAQLVPIPVEVPYEMVDGFKHLDFATTLSEHVLTMRDSALRQAAVALDVPAEILTGMGEMSHWGCVDTETEILTNEGWCTEDQLEVGDQVLTLGKDMGTTRWEPVLRVNRYPVGDIELVQLSGRYHSSLTTPNHRWLVQDRATRELRWTTSADGLVGDDLVVRGAPCADLPTTTKYDDALVELVAWYTTDGSVEERGHGRRPRVAIEQSRTANYENVVRIRRALAQVFGPPSLTLGSGGRGVAAQALPPRWCERSSHGTVSKFQLNVTASQVLVELAPGRVAPTSFICELTEGQLRLFMDVATRANGPRRYRGSTSTSKQLGNKHVERLAAFELAAVLLGMAVQWYEGVHVGFHEHVMHGVHATESPIRMIFRPQQKHRTTRSYTGTVWCPTTPSGTWLARRRGTVWYTGNSWQIEESAVKVHAEPLLEVVTGALTQGYLVPTLEALGEDTDGVVAWADTANMKTRPDRSRSAVELYDRLEIDGDALRRETGMSEFDRPDDAELARQAFIKMLANPQLAVTALQGLGIPVPTVTIEVTTPGQRGPGVDTEGPDEVGSDTRGPPLTRDDRDEPSGGPPPERAELAPVEGIAPDRYARLVLEGYVLRALERAGNRIRSQYRAQRSEELADCPPEQAHCCVGGVESVGELLKGAWDRVPSTARELGLDPVVTVQYLDDYCTTLLVKGFAHERSSFELALSPVLGRMLDD